MSSRRSMSRSSPQAVSINQISSGNASKICLPPLSPSKAKSLSLYFLENITGFPRPLPQVRQPIPLPLSANPRTKAQMVSACVNG